jgi:hypothetical protein
VVTDWPCSIEDLVALWELRAAEGGKSGSMKRSLGKWLALVGWAIGSCGAVLFICFWTFAMVYTRKAPFGALAMVALGMYGAWEGFKMFKAERNSK